MGLAFEQPVWLWAALAAAPMGLIAARWFLAMSAARRATAIAARALLAGLIAAMLAGAQSVRETSRHAVVAVVDVSGSVRRFADFGGDGDIAGFTRRMFGQLLEGRGPDDLFGLVVFDGRAVTIATPTRSWMLDRSMDVLPIEGSDLAGAMRQAAALIPGDATGRLVVVSDGNATGGDPVEAAASLASGAGGVSIPTDVIGLSYRVDDEVIVERLDAPPRAAAGSRVPLRVELRSTGSSTGTLRLLREGEVVDLGGRGGGRRVSLGPGRHVEILEVDLAEGRLSRFEVIYEPDTLENGSLSGDRTLDNNRGEAFTISPGESRVLVVDGVDGGLPGGPGSALPRTLRRSGLSVEVVAPSGMPRDLLGLQAYDLVLMQNVSADGLAEGSSEQLSAWVRELGGGLIVVGGPDTLGTGGWRGGALEAILPVRLDLPEKLISPEAAIVIVLDNSGSMSRPVMGSSRTQQEVANEAAARAIRSLDKTDLIGVISFNSVAGVVVPLGPATDTRAVAQRTLAIAPGGGTNIGPALAMARDQLLASDAKHKHVILLSDGQSIGAEGLPGLAEQIRGEGIRISSIAVGDEADLSTMEAIANRADGAFYHVLNPSVLPNVFLKAVRMERSPLIREKRFVPVMLETGSALTEGLGQPPALGGLVLTQSREESGITTAMLSPEGEPVLAHWAVELGQVAVFTSDASRWASLWLDWPGYEKFWSRAARLLARSTGEELGELRVERGEGRLRIVYEAADEDGRAIDLLNVPATVYGPGGESESIMLRQTGPGRYAGEARAWRGGNHLVIAKPRLGSTPLPPLLGGTTISSGEEYRRLSSDLATLRRIASAGGGRVLEADDLSVALFDRSGLPARRTLSPLWPALLAWTLLVFLLDVGTRRVAWDRLLPERGAEAELARIAAGAGRSVSVLRGVKGRRPGALTKAETLSEKDAERLRRDAMIRRYESREAETRAAAARIREKGAPEPAEPRAKAGEGPPADEGAKPEKDPAGEASGLMAAKMRARKRYESGGE